MVCIAQLVRALDCGSRGCQFDSDYTPKIKMKIGDCFYLFCLLWNGLRGWSGSLRDERSEVEIQLELINQS